MSSSPDSEPVGNRIGRVAVIVPTYNEAANMPELASRLFGLGLPDVWLYIVDDASPDGTAAVARRLSGEYGGRIEVISRSGKLHCASKRRLRRKPKANSSPP